MRRLRIPYFFVLSSYLESNVEMRCQASVARIVLTALRSDAIFTGALSFTMTSVSSSVPDITSTFCCLASVATYTESCFSKGQSATQKP